MWSEPGASELALDQKMSVEQRSFKAMKTKRIRNRSRLNGQRRLGATPRRAREQCTAVDLSSFGKRHSRPHLSLPRSNCRISLSRILVPIDFSAEFRQD